MFLSIIIITITDILYILCSLVLPDINVQVLLGSYPVKFPESKAFHALFFFLQQVALFNYKYKLCNYLALVSSHVREHT